MTLEDIWRNIKYTVTHKKVFIKTEKLLRGNITLSGILHDTDKMFLYLILPKRLVSKIHRYWSKHPTESFWSNKDWEQAVIDWGCARVTKKDKPLSARQTMEKYYNEYRGYIEPVLTKFNL